MLENSLLSLNSVYEAILLNNVGRAPGGALKVKANFYVPSLDPNNEAKKDTRVIFEKNKSLVGAKGNGVMNNSIIAYIPHYMFPNFVFSAITEKKDEPDDDPKKWNYNSGSGIKKGTKFAIVFVDGDINKPCIIGLL